MLYTTLLEGYSLVLYKRGTQAARRWLTEVDASSVLMNPLPEDYQSTFNLVAAYPDQRISLFDGLLAAVSRRLDLAVWTFDHQFDVVDANVWRW